MAKIDKDVQCAIAEEFIALQNQRLAKAVRKTQIVIWISQLVCFGIGVVFGALVF